MTFDEIQGNRRLISRLKNAVDTGCVSHAYLFTGSYSDYRNSFAKAFVSALMCRDRGCGMCRTCRLVEKEIHPDVLYVRAQQGHRLIDDQIENMQKFLLSRPVEGQIHVCIIDGADTMTERAQNRLLKTLEEPAAGTYIIMLAHNAETFLQTVISRCVHFRLETDDIQPGDDAVKLAEELENLMYERTPFYIMKPLAEKIGKDKDTAVNVIDSLERIYRDMVLTGSRKYSASRIFEYVDIIEETRRRIDRNVKTVNALKYMMLKIGG